ncbi:MAG TPA: hypothetical protein ENN09_04500 [Planctomycetes bacterium]|nr:hypothetical protein [Planctomycetota bacterium]
MVLGDIVRPRKEGEPAKWPVLLFGVVVIGVIAGYYAYRARTAPEPGAKPRRVVAEPNNPPDTAQVRVRKQVMDAAEEWREKMLAKPEEERTTPDGKVLVPHVVVYEDKDVIIPLRVMVLKDTEHEYVPSWEQDAKKHRPPEPTD